MSRGYLGAFEGIDGCGKTTIVRLIRDSLLSAGRLVEVYTSPSLSALGQCINERLNVSEDEDRLVNFILLLADRMTQILGSKGIIKNLEQGKVVLCDRFYHSLIVYQDDFTPDYFLNSSNYLVKDLVDFDLLFYLDVSPEIAYSRICKRGEVIEREEEIEKLIEKRQKYLRVLSEESDKEKIRVIDANRSVDEGLLEIVKEIVQKVLLSKERQL